MKNFLLRLLTGAGLLLIFGLVFVCLPLSYFSLLIFLVGIEILILEWPSFAHENSLYWVFGLIYILMPLALLIALNESGYRAILRLLLLVVPACDIGGYLLGKTFGKHKLCPKVSPGKTWEGVAGSYLAVLAILFGFKYWFASNASPSLILIFGFMITFLAVLGDLFESWLKRCAGIKDSGKLLPGHGGFLDRIDSLVFTTILFYVLRDLISSHLG